MNPNEKAVYLLLEKARKYDELLMMQHTKELCCSFCGKSQSIVKKLISSPDALICNECVQICNDILSVQSEPEVESEPDKKEV